MRLGLGMYKPPQEGATAEVSVADAGTSVVPFGDTGQWAYGNDSEPEPIALDETPAADEPEDDEAAPVAADPAPEDATPQVSGPAERLLATLSELGVDPEAYLAAVQHLAANPQAADPVESVVDARLRADPSYMAEVERLNSETADLTAAEAAALSRSLIATRDTAILREELSRERAVNETARRANGEAAALSALSASAEFGGHLKTAEARTRLAAYARKNGVADLTIAAKAMFYDQRQAVKAQTVKAQTARAAQAEIPAAARGGAGRHSGGPGETGIPLSVRSEVYRTKGARALLAMLNRE